LPAPFGFKAMRAAKQRRKTPFDIFQETHYLQRSEVSARLSQGEVAYLQITVKRTQANGVHAKTKLR
jgi:hypothetical protein